jgi:signal recognition particle receptor subunit beta
MDNFYLIILTSLIGLVIIALIVYFFASRKAEKPAKGNKIYLLGPKSCGKTQFFLKITSSHSPDADQTSTKKSISTVTSIQPNEFVIDQSMTLVDTPGHKRLRPAVEELKEARSFVVWITDDSLTTDTEYLLKLFNKSLKDQVPILIVSDILQDKIQAALEECVERIYKTEIDNPFCEFSLDTCKMIKSIDGVNDLNAF